MDSVIIAEIREETTLYLCFFESGKYNNVLSRIILANTCFLDITFCNITQPFFPCPPKQNKLILKKICFLIYLNYKIVDN